MKLFKRSPLATSAWHFKFTHQGVTYPRSTDTADKDLARQVARAKRKQIIDALIRGSLEELEGTKLRHTSAPPVTDLETLYKHCTASGITANAQSRKQNWNCLLHVLHVAAGFSLRDLPSAAKSWFNSAGLKATQADQLTAARLKRSANSIYNQAAAVFTPAAVAAYCDKDHNPKAAIYKEFAPQMREFATNYKAHKFNKLPRKTYNHPSQEIVDATLRAWEQLTDRDLFLAIGLELAFGLRLGEVRQVRAEWLTIRQGVPMLDSTATVAAGFSLRPDPSSPSQPSRDTLRVKNHSGLLQIRALDPFYTTLRARATAFKWLPDEGPLFPEPLTLGNRVSAFLRGQGWQTVKTNHALREYAGSQIYMKFGPHDAMTWLRHSNIQTTTDYYTGFVNPVQQLDRDAIPIDWATVTGTFQPKIVEL